MADYIHIVDIKIPPGFTNQNRHNTPGTIKDAIGRQSGDQPWKVTSVRPIRKTVFEYDQDGEIIEITAVADEWLVCCDLTYETEWADDDEMARDFEERIALGLGKPVAALKNKITATRKTHVEVLVLAALWDLGV